MIRPLLSRPLLFLRTPLLPKPALFAFSSGTLQEGEGQVEGQELDRAENFYRNSIRRININDKGKGKFTEHHLLRLTKLTEKVSQVPLLLEGYYNYLGHFTVISSKTVDRMLERVMSFEETPLDSVLEIFQNHNYLAYFPAYRTTLQFLKLVEKDEETLLKFIVVLISSPLIKFNRPIVDQLLQILQAASISQGTFSSIVKLLTQRSVFQIINEEIAPSELLKTLAASLEARFSAPWSTMQPNKYIVQFLDSVKESSKASDDLHSQLVIFGLSFGMRSIVSNNLTLIKDQTRVEAILNYLRNSPQFYSQSVLNNLKEQQLSQGVAKMVETLHNQKRETGQKEQ